MDAQSSHKVVAMGFWLPCGQANFFDPSEDRLLLRSNNLADINLKLHSRIQMRNLTSVSGLSTQIEDIQHIEASVSRRLVTVLSKKGYTRVFWLLPPYHQDYKDDSDPEAIVLICDNEHLKNWLTEVKSKEPVPQLETLSKIVTSIKGLILIVNNEGFYLWLAIHNNDSEILFQNGEREYLADMETDTRDEYILNKEVDALAYIKENGDDVLRRHIEEKGEEALREFIEKRWEDELRKHIEDKRKDELKKSKEEKGEQGLKEYIVEKALRTYIEMMVGGEYFSRFSGKKTVNVEHYVADYERMTTLTQYRDEPKGILNFFQLNLILEGMYNSTFDPEVFFSQDFLLPALKKIKEKYTLGSFAKLITALVPLEKNVESEEAIKLPGRHQSLSLVENLSSLLEARLLPSQQTEKNLLTKRLLDQCLTDMTRGDILRQFLRNTSTHSLRNLKWHIERCRRSLLSEMIGITHRRQPLLQAESPDEGTDFITEANEAQIRGYVMLISAKLPLITNIQRHLNSAIERINDQDIKHSLSSFNTSWNSLVNAISDNIERLEHAIEQAGMDQMLYEEEQVRAEQETMAEIERVKERSANTLSEMDSTSIGIVANLVAILTFSIAIVTLGNNPISKGIVQLLQSAVQQLGGAPFLQLIMFVLVILFGILLVILVYIAIVVVFQIFIGEAIRRFRGFMHARLGLGHRYYYELDMRLDAPISVNLAEKLFKADFDDVLGRPSRKVSNTTAGISVAELENGFQIIVPADDAFRKLKVYIGVCNAEGKLTAVLSDNSAPPYSQLFPNSPDRTTHRFYTLTYKAKSNGQALTVTFTMQSGSGHVTLYAATLADGNIDGSGRSLVGDGPYDLPTSTIDLTSEGTTDWAHWGLNTESSFNHKHEGGLKISNYRLIGSGKVFQTNDNPHGFTWTDGMVFSKVERNSYRVERMGEDEALHKVHIETDIIWPKEKLPWLSIYRPRKMKCYLTYELLFHRPSKANDYILRELRLVSIYDKILSPQQLGDLKRIVIEKFINCWLEKNFKLNNDPTEEPLLALTFVDIKTLTPTSGNGG